MVERIFPVYVFQVPYRGKWECEGMLDQNRKDNVEDCSEKGVKGRSIKESTNGTRGEDPIVPPKPNVNWAPVGGSSHKDQAYRLNKFQISK